MTVSIDEFFDSKGSFLKAKDVKDGSSFTIEKFEKIKTAISPTSPVLRLKNVESPFGLNKTNMTTLIEMFGNNEKKWAGKKIRLHHTMVNNPTTGKMQKGLAIS